MNPILSGIVGIAFLSLIPTAMALKIAKGKYDILSAPRKERYALYITALVNYLIATLIFWYFDVNSMFLISLAFVIVGIALAIINVFWKISAHTAGITGPVTAFIYFYGINLVPLYLFVLPVIYLRYKAKVHTITQLVAGALIGIIVTFLTFAIFY